jgi:hypothetical protein
MSHSVPSDSSAIDATFLVGTDLVEFDRRELPIYAAPQAQLMDAAHDAPSAYGAPLDRLFGEPGDVHVDASVLGHGEPPIDAATAVVTDDPLIALASLADGLAIGDAHGAIAPELATHFDFSFGADAHTVVHLHDGMTPWDGLGLDATFDFHAG